MSTIFITGANRGIGLEFVKQYATEGWRVIATCRDPIGVGELSNIKGNIEVHGLDVNDLSQLNRLSNDLNKDKFDLLINNAGIYGPEYLKPGDPDTNEWLKVFKTNTIAPLNVCQSFLPNLKEIRGKIIVLSSKMGSISNNSSGGSYIYRSSKAALNSVMKSLAKDFQKHLIPVFIFHPGWVQTKMGGPNAQISVKTCVKNLRHVISTLTMKESGQFISYDGTKISW